MSSSTAPEADLRVVPDLGDELLYAIGQVEELLLTLAVWEQEDGAEFPEPFAGGVALAALDEVASAVRPTQSRDEREPVPGRLLGPDGRYEHMPLRFVRIPGAHLEVLEHAAQVLALGGSGNDDLADALDQHAENRISRDALAGSLSRTVSLLGLAWDDDVQTLWGAVTAHPSSCDVVLRAGEEQAYRRVAGRVNTLWAYGSPIDRFLY